MEVIGIFVDTRGWIALGYRGGPRHAEVKRIYQEFRQNQIPIRIRLRLLNACESIRRLIAQVVSRRLKPVLSPLQLTLALSPDLEIGPVGSLNLIRMGGRDGSTLV